MLLFFNYHWSGSVGATAAVTSAACAGRTGRTWRTRGSGWSHQPRKVGEEFVPLLLDLFRSSTAVRI